MIKGKVIPNNLVVFLVVFYTSMGISKYIQVLWFNNHNALFNYSLSYASMAIFGSLSFIISSFINHWSIQKLLRVFLPLYAIGMSLRVFYESPIIAILSGGISGIGASVCLLAIRSWIYYLSDENKEHKEKIISFRYTIMQISLTIATLISGQLIFFINTNNKYIYLLVISAIMLLFLIGMKNIPIRNSVETKKNKKTFKLPTNKSHSIFLYLSVLILGISTSLIEPLIPVLIKNVGYNAAVASIIYTIYGIFKVLSIFLFKFNIFSRNASKTFVTLELTSGIIIIILGFIGIDKILMVVLLMIIGIETAGFFVLKEIMEYDMLPKNELVLYLGIIQSAFLLGDALGSILGASIYTVYGENILISILGMIIIISGAAYHRMYVYMKKQRNFCSSDHGTQT